MPEEERKLQQTIRRKRSRSRSPVHRSRSQSKERVQGRRDKNRRVNCNYVIVSNIPYDVKWKDLKDIFQKEVGDVAYVDMFTDGEGKSTGTGMIEFKDLKTASKALEKMHRYQINDRRIVVREEKERDRRMQQKDGQRVNTGPGLMGVPASLMGNMGGPGMMGNMGGHGLMGSMPGSLMGEMSPMGMGGGMNMNPGMLEGMGGMSGMSGMSNMGMMGQMGRQIPDLMMSNERELRESRNRQVSDMASGMMSGGMMGNTGGMMGNTGGMMGNTGGMMGNTGGMMGNTGGMMGNTGGMMGNTGDMMGNTGGMTENFGGGDPAHKIMETLGIDEPLTDTLFVYNLDYKVTNKKLRDVFGLAGNVVKAEVKTDKDGTSRGMAHVQFEHPVEAMQAISMFNGQNLYERAMRVKLDTSDAFKIREKDIQLPSGLDSIGLGFGRGGRPLDNIAKLSKCGELTTVMGGGGMPSSSNSGSSAGLGTGSGLSSMGGMGVTGMGSLGGTGLGNMNTLSGMGGIGARIGMGGMSSREGINSLGGVSSMSSMSSGMGGGNMSGMGSSNMESVMGSGMSGLNRMAAGMNSGRSDMSASLGFGGMGDGFTGSAASSLMSSNAQQRRMGLSSMGLTSRDTQRRESKDNRQRRSLMEQQGGNVMVKVKNIPLSWTWKELSERFQDVGDVKFAEIKIEDGRSAGWGLVKFATPECAQRAINIFHQSHIEGREIEVYLY